jgi:hypothetical protein
MSVVSAAKQEMIKSKLPNNVLGRIWKLSDVDKVGTTTDSLIYYRRLWSTFKNLGKGLLSVFLKLYHLLKSQLVEYLG